MFNINRYWYCFYTEPNQAFFWHGQTTDANGIVHGGMNNARSIAAFNNGKTLEMCMIEHIDELEQGGVNISFFPDGTIDSINYGTTKEENDQFWLDCSKAFAEQASGDIHVIEGTDLRKDGTAESDYPCIYNTTEHEMLSVYNPEITSITSVDAVTGQETSKVETFDKNYDFSYGIY